MIKPKRLSVFKPDFFSSALTSGLASTLGWAAAGTAAVAAWAAGTWGLGYCLAPGALCGLRPFLPLPFLCAAANDKIDKMVKVFIFILFTFSSFYNFWLVDHF